MSPRIKYNIFLFNKKNNWNNVNSSLFMQLAKIKQQNEWKKKPRASEYGPWILTGQVNSYIQELLLRQFCSLIFAPSEKC